MNMRISSSSSGTPVLDENSGRISCLSSAPLENSSGMPATSTRPVLTASAMAGNGTTAHLTSLSGSSPPEISAARAHSSIELR